MPATRHPAPSSAWVQAGRGRHREGWRPATTHQALTEKAAGDFAELARSLRERGLGCAGARAGTAAAAADPRRPRPAPAPDSRVERGRGRGSRGRGGRPGVGRGVCACVRVRLRVSSCRSAEPSHERQRSTHHM